MSIHRKNSSVSLKSTISRKGKPFRRNLVFDVFVGMVSSETGERIRVFNSIGPLGAPKVARGFWVEQREAPFMHEGHYYTAERKKAFARGVC